MRLLDGVNQADTEIVVETPRGERRLPGAGAIASALAECPFRFVCDGAVTAAAAAVALDFRLLSGCVDLIRLPAQSVWIEWDEDVRRMYFRENGIGRGDIPENAGQRVGALVQADEQRLRIQICWSRPDRERIELSPVSIEMDLSAERDAASGDDRVHLCVDDDAADALFERLSFVIRPEWRAYYGEFGAAATEAVANAQRVALDANMVMAFALLMAAREPLRHLSVDRCQLNRARLRRGRQPLLHHVELAMPLSVAKIERGLQTGSDTHRAASRLHIVRAHLVRRGAGIFWRRAHLRGHPDRGQIATRTISLRA